LKGGSFMVDKSLILRKLAELEECPEQIKEYSDINAIVDVLKENGETKA